MTSPQNTCIKLSQKLQMQCTVGYDTHLNRGIRFGRPELWQKYIYLDIISLQG